jgi:Fe2+ transport system protein FeoA
MGIEQPVQIWYFRTGNNARVHYDSDWRNGFAMKKLSEIALGIRCTIQSFSAGPETCQRLREMGFHERTMIRIAVKTPSQIICELHNTRIGLHNRIAKGVLVVPVDSLNA